MTKNLQCHLFTLSILFLLMFSGIMYAQGKIIGKVTDKSNGEPLLGVNVVILGTYMGAATDENGEYIIVNVPVGTYSLQASMVGTNKVTLTNVIVSQNQTTRVDFQLEQTAIVGEEVVITAKRDILHKEVSSSQIVIDNKQLSEAAGVRTLQDFISTQAGITGTDYLNIREGRPSETGTVINGLTFVNARVGKTESLIPTSAVEQVSLKAGGMSAEYGDFRSGVINVATKYGTSEGYHGTFSFTRSPAHLKRFGPSLYDPMNNYLRPHLDPEIAFIGVNEAVKRGIIDNYQKQQFTQYPSFAGWIQINSKSLPAAWKNKGITPVDLYLYDAWMHMVMPDFEKLNKVIRDLNAEGLNVGNEVTDQNLMSLFARHANKEGKYGDYNFDGGFGGPVPFIGKALGNATFYLSNVTKRQTYIQPLELDFDFSSSTMLALKSNITNSITLKLTGVYTYQKGMNPARGADSEIPNLATANDLGSSVYQGLDRGALMPENNIPLFVAYGSNYGPIYYWYPTMLQPWIQKNYLIGANLTHAISSKTFYDFTISYQSTKEDINATQTRDLSVITHIGPIPVTEMPYGRRILNVGQSQDTIDGFIFDQYYSVPGLAERFDSKGGCFYDNSLTRQLRMKFNFGSQITKMHFIKAGLEFNYINL
ncbi:MAG: TonB-dependent receptor, partial [Melioribacter sp.]|nr:TonB-dependent receptor [Melioribacter sp.]